jgi:hypothetical protein
LKQGINNKKYQVLFLDDLEGKINLSYSLMLRQIAKFSISLTQIKIYSELDNRRFGSFPKNFLTIRGNFDSIELVSNKFNAFY